MHTRTGAVQEHDVHSLRIMGLVAAISSFFGYGRCACRPVQRHAVRDNQDYTMDTLDLKAGKLPGSIESRAEATFFLPTQTGRIGHQISKCTCTRTYFTRTPE